MASNRPIFNKLVIQGSFMGKLWNEIFKYQYLPFLITGVRQFSISFVADFIFCVAHPIVLIYNASVIRHRLVDTIKVYGSYLVELFTNHWINHKRKSIKIFMTFSFIPLCNFPEITLSVCYEVNHIEVTDRQTLDWQQWLFKGFDMPVKATRWSCFRVKLQPRRNC